MRALGHRRVAALAVAALVALAIVGWAAARQIRSPAQVAADTAAPQPAPITVPVERRTLSTEVIVRGTVRFGAAQPAVLATSRVKQGSDIVTRAPRRKAELATGEWRGGRRPSRVRAPGGAAHGRDLLGGRRAPTCSSSSGRWRAWALSGRSTATTTPGPKRPCRFYLRQGWAPFGPTDVQLEQLRTAETAAAQARDAHLQALNTIDQARTATPAEVEQARLDAVAAQDALDTALLAVPTAEAKLATARTAATNAKSAEALAVANAKRDQAVADADVAAKRAALDGAIDDQQVAQLKVFDVPLDAPASDREGAAAAARAAAAAVPRARAELDAAIATAAAARTGTSDARRRARADGAQASSDARVAADELRRARLALQTARATARISTQRVRILSRPADRPRCTRSPAPPPKRSAARRPRWRASRRRRGPGPRQRGPVLPDAAAPRRRREGQARRLGLRERDERHQLEAGRRLVAVGLGRQARAPRRSGGDRGPGPRDQGRRPGQPGRPDAGDRPRRPQPVLPRRDAGHRRAGARRRLGQADDRGQEHEGPRPRGPGQRAVGRRRRRLAGAGAPRPRTTLIKVVPGLAAQGLVEIRPAGSAALAPGDLVIVGSRRG